MDNFIPNQPLVDNSTFGNIDEIYTYHYHLNLTVSFDDEILSGSNTLDMHTLAMTDKIVLDVWKLDVYRVELVNYNSATNAGYGKEVVPVQNLDFKVMTLNENIGDTFII